MMTTIHGFPVIARKRSNYALDADAVIVDRGEGVYERYVTGLVSSRDDAPESWFWGHYFNDLGLATVDYTTR